MYGEERYLTEEEKQILEDDSYSNEIYGAEFAAVLNPQSSYKTLYDAGVADQYANGLLVGQYPEDESNQIMISVLTAQQFCSESESCKIIDDLVGQEVTLDFTGILEDNTESIITATAVISGIYIGINAYNDIILAYDGLNPDDTQTSDDLK